jgi:hypothetical protein
MPARAAGESGATATIRVVVTAQVYKGSAGTV